MPEDGNKTKYEKSDIEGCLKCSGSFKNRKCDLCKEDYLLNNNICIKEEKCEIGENEKCKSF